MPEECNRLDLVREPIFSLLGIFAICLALWFTTARLVDAFRSTLPSGPSLPHTVLEWAPKSLVTAVLLAAATSIYASIPYSFAASGANAVQEIAKRNHIIKVGQGAIADADVELMSRVVQKLTLFTGMLGTGALLLLALAVIALVVLPTHRRSGTSASASPVISLVSRPAVILSTGFTTVLLILFVAFPVSLPQSLGPITVVALAFACLTVLFGQLSYLSTTRRIPFITIVVIWLASLSFTGINNNHNIRTGAISAEKIKPGGEVPTLKEHLRIWYDNRKDAKRYANPADPKPYPVYIVAAQGGGIYAAYHSARLLASLQDRCPLFGQHLFAISGVSGGASVLHYSLRSARRKVASWPRTLHHVSARARCAPCYSSERLWRLP